MFLSQVAVTQFPPTSIILSSIILPLNPYHQSRSPSSSPKPNNKHQTPIPNPQSPTLNPNPQSANPQFTIPNPSPQCQSPIHNLHSIPHSPFRIPHSPFPTPHSQSPFPNTKPKTPNPYPNLIPRPVLINRYQRKSEMLRSCLISRHINKQNLIRGLRPCHHLRSCCLINITRVSKSVLGWLSRPRLLSSVDPGLNIVNSYLNISREP